MRRHRFLLFLAAVFAAKLVVVLQLRDHALLQPDLAGFETTVFTRLAAAIASGGSWFPPGLFVVPPLYACFLALILTAAKTLAAARIAQIVLGTAAVACVFGATRVWFGERAAWSAALLAALTGLFTFYEALLLPSALDPFLTAAALAALAVALAPGHRGTKRSEGIQGWLWLAVAGIAFGLLILNRPIASTQAGLHFYIGNNAASDGTYRPAAGIAAGDPHQQHADARAIAEASAGQRLDDREVSAYFFALGRSWIRLHPADAVKHFARKVALTLNAGHIADSYSYPFYVYDTDTLLRFLFIGPWLLLPLGIVGLAIGVVQIRRADYLIWVSLVPLYGLTVALFVVTERERLPLLVPLCIGAGATVDFLVFRRSARPSWRARALTLAGVLIAAALANLPIERDDGRAEERTRMAEAMVVRDRIDLAEQWSAKAEAIHTRPADVHLRVGRRLIVHSRPEAAIAHLERALRSDPSSADANYAMGQALLQARRPREAIPRLRAALAAGIRENLVAYDLARAMAAAGDRAGALQTLQAVRPDAASDAERWMALGQLALQLESPSLAAAFFNGAVAAAPRSPQAHRDLGLALTQLGRHQDAVLQLEQAAALDPADPATRLYLARARRSLQKHR